jgi:hypothetical protein
MIRMRLLWLVLVLALTRGHLVSQEHPDLIRAEQAWEALEYETVVAAAQAYLETQDLTQSERARGWELIAFAYQALGSDESSIAAFRQVLQNDPDHQLDPEIVSPQLIPLFNTALGRELVVRNVAFTDTSFVAGQGALHVSFDVTMPANQVETRVIGPGIDRLLAITNVTDRGVVEWDALTPEGIPFPPGVYSLVINASALRTEYPRTVELEVRHGTLDTLEHVTAITGIRDTFPEEEVPPRRWEPLVVAAAAAAVTTGAVLALESSPPEGFARRELIAIDVAALLTGLTWSLRTPEPQPIPANIQANRIVRELIINENLQIAQDNERRRQQVLITVVPTRQPPP